MNSNMADLLKTSYLQNQVDDLQIQATNSLTTKFRNTKNLKYSLIDNRNKECFTTLLTKHTVSANEHHLNCCPTTSLLQVQSIPQ